jgi:hypothetical protein
MTNELPVYNGIPALTPHDTTASIHEKLLLIMSNLDPEAHVRAAVNDFEKAEGRTDHKNRLYVDAIMAAFTVTERNQSND